MNNFENLEIKGLIDLNESETYEFRGGSASDAPSLYKIAYTIGKTFRATLYGTFSIGGLR